MTIEPGATVALTSCPAELLTGAQITVSGLWEIEEFHPYDRAAYVHEPCFTLVRGTAPFAVSITADDLREQVNPASHARQLVLEREMDWHN